MSGTERYTALLSDTLQCELIESRFNMCSLSITWLDLENLLTEMTMRMAKTRQINRYTLRVRELFRRNHDSKA